MPTVYRGAGPPTSRMTTGSEPASTSGQMRQTGPKGAFASFRKNQRKTSHGDLHVRARMRCASSRKKSGKRAAPQEGNTKSGPLRTEAGVFNAGKRAGNRTCRSTGKAQGSQVRNPKSVTPCDRRTAGTPRKRAGAIIRLRVEWASCHPRKGEGATMARYGV